MGRQAPAARASAGSAAARQCRPIAPAADGPTPNSHDSRTSSCSKSASRAGSTSTSKAIRSCGAGARPTIPSCSRTGTTNFFGWNAADFGWGADRTENILWRLENGELDGVNPKVIVLLAGTNNVGDGPGRTTTKVADIARGRESHRRRLPREGAERDDHPHGDLPAQRQHGRHADDQADQRELATLADGKQIRFLNINDRLADKGGKLVDGVMNERDKLHPTVKGYQIWADALKPILRELLGPPAATDLAPPPTGIPTVAGQ